MEEEEEQKEKEEEEVVKEQERVADSPTFIYLRFLLRFDDMEEEEEPPPLLESCCERIGTVPSGCSYSPLICRGFTRSKLPSLVCKETGRRKGKGVKKGSGSGSGRILDSPRQADCVQSTAQRQHVASAHDG